MSLKNATSAQLWEWLDAITNEIAERLDRVEHAQPPPPVPPWESATAKIERAKAYRPQPKPEIAPGVRPTLKTDPALAAKFAQIPVRHEGQSGRQGDGIGEDD